MNCLTFQPTQGSDGMSEYNYMPDGYPSMTQVSTQDKQWVKWLLSALDSKGRVCNMAVLQLLVTKLVLQSHGDRFGLIFTPIGIPAILSARSSCQHISGQWDFGRYEIFKMV